MEVDAQMTIADNLATIQATATVRIGKPGDWLSGRQRVRAWAEARDAATNPLDEARRTSISPSAVDGRHPGTDDMPSAAVEVVHRLASDPGRLGRSWADEVIGELGEGVYTELVGVTSIVAVIDTFDRIMGHPPRPLPEVQPGEPSLARPDDVGDVGAWVSQTVDKTRANVSRALSLVPETNSVWRPLVDAHYSRGMEFYDLAWSRALSRPQVELVAARTTVLNECFY